MHTNALLSLVFSIQYPLEGCIPRSSSRRATRLPRLIAEAAGD
jgi:hypothetical protein